jgi:uracil-DNA glycosylase family 4
MAGFFDIEDLNIIRGDEVKRDRPLAVTSVNCDTCGLYTQCQSPRMKPTGQGRLGILVVAEAPGKTEDEQGIQLVGKTGRLLREILKEIDLDLDRDFWKTNALCCRPPENTNPEPLQLAACRKRLMACIERYNPNVIITLGKYAMDGLIGHRLVGRLGDKDPSMTDWSGCQIPDQELGRWILPTWHPSYIARSREDPVLINQLKAQFRKAIQLANVPIPQLSYEEFCSPIYKVRDAIAVVRDARKSSKLIAFDYETTGIKPHRPGHKIYTASLSDGEQAFAFPFFDDEDFREEWRRFLTTGKIERIAHGAKYEITWTKAILGYWPLIEHDTMLGAHCAHNRKLTNLKFQTYINFGILGYDSEIDIYLETTEQQRKLYGANGFNCIDQAPLDKLLLYNAGDSLFTNRLHFKQQDEQLTKEQKKGLDFFVNSSRRLAECESNGIVLDAERANRTNKELMDKLEQIEDEIRAMPELEKWNKSTPFRPSADDDLAHLVFNILGYKSKEKTPSGKPKTDKSVMEKIDLPVVQKVLEWKKWHKARNTYVKQYIREAVDGIIHPVFNLHFVDTFRSSSDSPNFQNVPKRQKDVKKVLRSLLVPHPGHMLVEYDYKAVEVAVSACYNQDPNLLKYVRDPSTDMHRDTGMELFFRDLDWFLNPRSKELGDLAKAERQIAKNAFVFPEFYGSYFEQIAPDIWGDLGPETKQHLKEKGIRGLKDFTEHVEAIEEDFWEKRFPVYAQWKKDTYEEYEHRGYIDSYTGFRYYGPMKRNEAVNYPIQGSAFHCLLWTLTRVMEEMEKRGMKSQLRSLFVGQIHDAAVGSIHPDEQAEIDYLIWYWGTQKILEYWDWIIVPLNIEKSFSKVDGTWAEMEDSGLLHF